MRIVAVLVVAFGAVIAASGALAQSTPAGAGASQRSERASGDDAKSEREKKEARKARREHRRMVNHRIRRKH